MTKKVQKPVFDVMHELLYYSVSASAIGVIHYQYYSDLFFLLGMLFVCTEKLVNFFIILFYLSELCCYVYSKRT